MLISLHYFYYLPSYPYVIAKLHLYCLIGQLACHLKRIERSEEEDSSHDVSWMLHVWCRLIWLSIMSISGYISYYLVA
jgi:hypothetical protein